MGHSAYIMLYCAVILLNGVHACAYGRYGLVYVYVYSTVFVMQ